MSLRDVGRAVARWRHGKPLAWVLGPMLLLLLVPPICGVRVELISRDPVQILRGPAYIGMVSNTGALLWMGSVTMCLFASRFCGTGERASFLRGFGILTAVLLVDDFYLIHDRVAPALRMPEIVLFILYGGGFVCLVVRFRRLLLEQTEYGFLAAAAVLMGASTAMDIGILPGGIDIEDSCKFIGMGFYFYFSAITAARFVREGRGKGGEGARSASNRGGDG